MNLQPTLIGHLIQLLPLTLEDCEELFKAAADPLIWEQHPDSNRYQKPEFEKYFKAALESKGAFKIIDLQSLKIIGSTRYYDFDPENQTVMIGFTFLEKS